MRLVPRLLLGLAVACVAGSGIGCRSASPGPSLPDPAAAGSTAAIPANRSRVEATVLAVERLEGPHFRLRMRVERVAEVPGYPSFAREGDTLEVYPNFVRREGAAIDYADESNRKMTSAADLSADSRIGAVLYQTGPGQWLLMAWDTL